MLQHTDRSEEVESTNTQKIILIQEVLLRSLQ